MSAPQRFRKKPVEIEAMQYDGAVGRATEIIDWALSQGGTITYHCDDDGSCERDSHVLNVRTLEGTMTALPGDWIIRGVANEFYPVKDVIFAATYEEPVLASAEKPEAPVPDAVRTKAALSAAIQEHSRAEWGGDLVVDWVLVAGLIDDGTGHAIGIEESRDVMPAYITTGLLHEALDLGGDYARVEDDDD